MPTQLAKTSRFATEWLILSHSPMERVAVAGELAPPFTSLSKYYFDKLTGAPSAMEGAPEIHPSGRTRGLLRHAGQRPAMPCPGEQMCIFT